METNKKKLLEIYIKCFLEAKKTNNVELMANTEFFFEEVMKSKLANTAKEWFELGALAQNVHDLSPKAINLMLRSYGKRITR